MRNEQSPYHSSRGNWKITAIVLHTTVGNYEGTINWFKNNPRSVSAHYVVREDGGEITQMVDESRASHHAGIVDRPDTPVYRGNNPNLYTIGIENADLGKPHDHDRTKQKVTLAKLVREICLKYGLPIDANHICGHREIRKSKTCPGNIDVKEIIDMARESGSTINDMDYKTTINETYKGILARNASNDEIVWRVSQLEKKEKTLGQIIDDILRSDGNSPLKWQEKHCEDRIEVLKGSMDTERTELIREYETKLKEAENKPPKEVEVVKKVYEKDLQGLVANFFLKLAMWAAG